MDLLRPNLVRKLCHDITVGLTALHRQGIVHGGVCMPAGTVLPPTNTVRP